MDHLVDLLGIEAPANTHLQGAEFSLRGLLPWWLAVVLLLALAVGVLRLYRLEKGIRWPRRILMAALRFGVLALLVVLLLRPVLLAEFAGQKPRSVVLLLDNSQSMKQQDRRLTKADKLRVALANGLLPLTTSLAGGESQAVVPAATPNNPARADLVASVLRHPGLQLIEGPGKDRPGKPPLVRLRRPRRRGPDAS